MHPPIDYYDLLRVIHQDLVPRTYLEIGVRNGDSLTLGLPGTLKIGIDPAPDIRHPLDPRTTRIFAQTSDDFFAAHDVRGLLGGRSLDLAFIDGMHLFEFALRDFINIERLSTPDSVVLVHDCLPIDAVTSARERTTAVWTGDVWKIVMVLKQYRPDLKVTTSDAGPSGLGIITHLDPASTVLTDRLHEIVAKWTPLGHEIVAGREGAELNVVPDAWSAVVDARLPRIAPNDLARVA